MRGLPVSYRGLVVRNGGIINCGIRLSGLALGRKKFGENGQKERRQMYRDACERNVVEGRNGNAKRRYGLDLIAAKLDETADLPELGLRFWIWQVWVKQRSGKVGLKP